MLFVPRKEFEDLVARALDEIPQELADLVDNVVFRVADWPPPGQNLLGLYQGVPLTQRTTNYAGVLPDTIWVYRIPILHMCDTLEDVVEQVHITVVHEIAHHFGIDDDHLHELGYG